MRDLPDFVKDEIREFQSKKKDGSLTINFRKGGVRNIKKEDVIHPPVK